MSHIISAFAVGISETLIGHPFNTAKVLIQNKKPHLGYHLNIIIEGLNIR